MLHSDLQNERWTLSDDAAPLLSHLTDRPFATALRREKSYAASHGSVKETVTEAERVPLTEVSGAQDAVTLSGGGHTLQIRVAPRDGGAELTLTGEPGWAYEFRLPVRKGEAVFGGGEQYRQLNLRGERVVNFVSEHIKASTILEKDLLPKALYREKSHAEIGSYAPMPVFVTDRGRLFLFDTEADGVSRFGADCFRFTFDACPRRLLLLRAGSYAALSALLASHVPNRQYIPDWCRDGMILGVQGGTKRVLEKAEALLDAGAKLSAVWCQDWCGQLRPIMGQQVWWNWEADEKLYPDLRGAIERLRARGVRFLAYINPYLVKDSRLYTLCRDKGWLITKTDGSVYHIRSTTFDAGMLDLTNPETARFIKDELIKKNMLDLGVSGWMADFGEYLPVDCVLHDGDPAALHNRWPVLWAKLNREAIEEYGAPDAFFFTRSGYLGVQSYAPVMWNGDQHTDLSRDYGLPCVLPASFSLGFSGVTLVHCDAGGFFSFERLKRDDELLIRWMELCAFSPLMRSHESIRPWANSQPYSPGVLPYTVRLTRLHAALAPYLRRCVEQAQSGLPALRPDFWEAMDCRAHRDEYSYLLGDELFVCPVIEKDVKTRRVWLPEGDWVHLWTETALPGGERLVPAPLGQPPVFYREGSAFKETFRAAAEAYKKER